jgi:tropomodulin
LNRKKLIEHINKQALETPDRPEVKPYVAGVIRGKKVRVPSLENIGELLE